MTTNYKITELFYLIDEFCKHFGAENLLEDNSIESNCSMIENIPPKGVSFSDLICIFAMSYQSFACLFLQH